jgi:chorismate mutase
VSTPGDPSADPVIRRLREQISDNDRAIVEGINRRLDLVSRLKEYKSARGYEFVDHAREDWMLAYLARANRGPLSSDGLRDIFEALLELTKREVARSDELRADEPAGRATTP